MHKLNKVDIDKLKSFIDMGNFQGRTMARTQGWEDFLDCNRENVIMMRIKTYLRSLTATDILHFMARVIEFAEKLLAPDAKFRPLDPLAERIAEEIVDEVNQELNKKGKGGGDG